jgi:hypothetical protein
MQRKEAVALFTELVAKGYVQPNLVSIEQRKTDKFQLKIRGDYNSKEFELFLKNKGCSYEENKGYLIIFKQ